MKRISLLICAALFISVSLCACMNTSAGRVEEKPTQSVSSVSSTENKNSDVIDKDKKETVRPTEDDTGVMETIVDAVATEWDDMIDDGQVEDGDGNVGDLENHDKDGNAAPEDE